MSEERNHVKVETNISSPGAAVTFIFSTYSILSFCQSNGLLGEGNALMIGIVQVSLALGFFACSIVNMCRGSAFGSVNMIFAVVFGLVGGLNGILTTYFSAKGIVYDPKVISITFLLAGIFVTGILPVLISLPLYSFLTNLSAALGLLAVGLAGILGWGNWAYSFGGWMFLITGVTGMYNAISEVCGDCGVHFPQGKSLPEMLKH